MSLTYTDVFCGAGGSSIGLTEAGLELKLAANHWQRAIETHAANFPNAEHLCADVNNYDMRRLPATDILWASPICTEVSPAGGNAGRRTQKAGQLEAFGHIAQAGYERTRATFHDIIRATEVHRYKAVLVENVVDVAWKWELFDWWCTGMIRLGYRMRVVCVSSAHVGDEANAHAPQWRDRMYLAFTRQDVPQPDLDPTPTAWCPECGHDVAAIQWWKPKAMRVLGQPVGKYRQQYLYQCPRAHAYVEPYVLPAAAVIDWSDLGTRIGDRDKPLATATQARILAGLRMLRETALVSVNHDDDGLASHPLLVPCGGSWNEAPYDASGRPFRTRTARESEAVLTTSVPTGAFYIKNYTANPHRMAKPVNQPFGTVTSSDHHSLVVPYRNGSAKSTRDPLLTLATRDSAGLATPTITDADVDDCRFRMLKPREQLRAQRFPDSYVVLGNVGEQTMQAGNAVSSNVAHWLGRAVAAVLS
jgi:DNA (cytosine-5)-methyltransferase 1